MVTDAADFTDAAEIDGTAPPFVPVPPSAAPLQTGLRGSVGSGKTRYIAREVKDVLARDAGAVAFVFVPDHALAGEMAGRVRAEVGPNVEVEVYRGMDQPDPAAPAGNPRKMCRRSADAGEVREAGGELADLCGSSKHGHCPHHPGAGGDCGYRRQAAKAESGAVRVWVLTHAMLGRDAPPPLRRHTTGPAGDKVRVPAADFVAIDERFWPAMLGGFGPAPVAVPAAALDTATFPTVPDGAGDIAPGSADGHVRKVLGLLSGVLAKATSGGRIGRATLEAAGLTAGACREAGVYVYRCKAALPVGALPRASTGTVAGLLGPLTAENRRVLRVHKLLEVAADVLAGRLGSAALKVSVRSRGREVDLRWRDEIAGDWLKAGHGIVHADGTMQEDTARVWLPGLKVLPSAPVAAPYMHVAQVGDGVFGYSSVIVPRPSPGQKATASAQTLEWQKTAARNARRVLRATETLAGHYAGKGAPGGPDALVVLPKALEDGFAGKLPGNVGTLHFGKLRGQDAYKGAAVVLVVSRPLPPPAAVEDMAEIIFGRDVARIPAGVRGVLYPTRKGARLMTDGTWRAVEKVAYHPDALAEAVRWACCEAELVQAIGRGRGIHRAEANPLKVVLMTSAPLDDVPVSEVVTLKDIWRDLAGADPVRELERIGVLPLDWPGLGAVLAGLGFYEGAKDPGAAARNWFLRNPAERARLAGLEAAVAEAGAKTNGAQTPIGRPLLSYWGLSAIRAPALSAPATGPAPSPSSPAGPIWPVFRYRRTGQRKAGLILVSPAHADPRAAVEALTGPLDLFTPGTAPRPAKACQHPAAVSALAAASVPSAPSLAIPLPVVVPVAPSAPVVPPPAAQPPRPSPVLVAVQADGDGDSAGRLAQLDATPIGLPALLNELVATGALTPAGRRRILDHFRISRGLPADRERAALGRLAIEVGPATLRRAARAVAARRLGVPFPAFTPCARPVVAAAA